jgi:hypothetical protein
LATLATLAYRRLGLIVPTRDCVTKGCRGADGGVGVAADGMCVGGVELVGKVDAVEGDASTFRDDEGAAAWVGGETVMGVVEATLRADGEGGTNSSRTRGVPCRRGGSGR